MKKNSTCVYQIKNESDGKIYIGSSRNYKTRWYNHKYKLRKDIHENHKLQNAWNEYGEDSFKFEVLELCEESERYQLEQSYISELKPYRDDIGYNNTNNVHYVPDWAYENFIEKNIDKLPWGVDELNYRDCGYTMQELVEYIDGVDTMLEYGTEEFGYDNFEDFAENYFN